MNTDTERAATTRLSCTDPWCHNGYRRVVGGSAFCGRCYTPWP